MVRHQSERNSRVFLCKYSTMTRSRPQKCRICPHVSQFTVTLPIYDHISIYNTVCEGHHASSICISRKRPNIRQENSFIFIPSDLYSVCGGFFFFLGCEWVCLYSVCQARCKKCLILNKRCKI